MSHGPGHICRLNGELREISGRMLRIENRMVLLERDVTILLGEVRRIMPAHSPSEALKKRLKLPMTKVSK